MHREAGFTLVEVMVAMMILSVALVALAGMQVVAIHVNAGAKTTTQLGVIAQQTMEELLALPYTDATLQDNAPTDVAKKTTYRAIAPPAGHAVQWTVNDHVLNPHVTIKAIDITVQRTITGKPGKTFTLSFARSNVGA